MAEETQSQYWNVYIGQAGASLQVVLDHDEATKLQQAVHNTGEPVGVWMRSGGGRTTTGITVNPCRGGVVLNMAPADRIPLDDEGNVVTEEGKAEGQQIARYLEPRQQNPGRVVPVEWTDPVVTQITQLAQALALLATEEVDDPPAELPPEPETPEPPEERGPPAPSPLDDDEVAVEGEPAPDPPQPPETAPRCSGKNRDGSQCKRQTWGGMCAQHAKAAASDSGNDVIDAV
jgi:FAD/FMN-containing dehydrogenase